MVRAAKAVWSLLQGPCGHCYRGVWSLLQGRVVIARGACGLCCKGRVVRATGAVWSLLEGRVVIARGACGPCCKVRVVRVTGAVWSLLEGRVDIARGACGPCCKGRVVRAAKAVWSVLQGPGRADGRCALVASMCGINLCFFNITTPLHSPSTPRELIKCDKFVLFVHNEFSERALSKTIILFQCKRKSTSFD